MFKAPVFNIHPLLGSYYLEQTGYKKLNFRTNKSINKSIKRLSKSINDPLRWVYITYDGVDHPVLLKKSIGCELIVSGPKQLYLKKAKLEKDLEYWKKKLLDIFKMEKSLEEILFPGILLKSLPDKTQELLIKARGYAAGTIREWGGKKYKKMSSGKWVRAYSEEESRGAKQAIRNVSKKIQNATSMDELVQIIKENKERFQDENGRMLPIVKEFLMVARGTESGKKEKIPVYEDGKYQIEYMNGKYLVPGRQTPDKNNINSQRFANLDDAIKQAEENRMLDKKRIDALKGDKKEETKKIGPDGTFKMSEEEAMDIVGELNDRNIDNVEFSYSEDFGEVTFFAEIDNGDITENIVINPFDEKDIEEKTGRGKDKKKRKQRSDKDNIENNKEKQEKIEDPVKIEKSVEEKYKDIKPNQEPKEGEKAQITIEEANPTNRIKKTLELSGTSEKFKTQEEVVEKEVGSIEPFKPIQKNIELNVFKNKKSMADTDKKESVSLNTTDYTDINSLNISIKPISHYKKIAEGLDTTEKIKDELVKNTPEYVLPLDYKQFERMGYTIDFAKIGDNKYIIPKNQSFRSGGNYSVGGPSFEDISSKEYFIVPLDVVVATQDHYRKIGKVLNDKKNSDYAERIKSLYGDRYKAKKSNMKILSSNKMHYDQQFLQEAFMNNKRSDYWTTYADLQKEFKQKSSDMQTMQEEIDNTFSKGRETAYGDTNTSDSLKPEYGVKIKRQDGSDITPEDEKYLSKALDDIQKTFGNRVSMNEKVGLKLSFAKGTAMHARKAVGLYMPTLKAIGISDGKGLKKKDRITGEMKEVNYGDENFGGFVLAHEYAHMMDNYLGEKNKKWFASDDYDSTAGQIAKTFRDNMNEDSKSDYINRTCECFARALEQYHAIETVGIDAKSFYGKYIHESQYVNEEIYNTKIKPLVEKFFSENDEMLKAIKVDIN